MPATFDHAQMKITADRARQLFVEDATSAVEKCYDLEVSDEVCRSALRWLEVADGLERTIWTTRKPTASA